MGTGNALRATETFTLIQLEEERQKLKKKELLKNMLTDSEFSIKGQCAINLMMTKLDIINTFLLMKYNRNFIQMKTGRLKSYDSVCKKMQKKGLDLNFSQALEKINDLIGVRAVCAYVDDIYKVADLIEKQQDIRILKVKDYVQQPKKSGYQSLHLILEIAIPFQKENQWIKLELQLRTAAMDYWANLDHQLRYKRGQKQAAVINEELQQCASVITQLDQKMLDIRKKIDKI
ncbi:GTP pyrophosphokinase [Blautia sp. MSJ-19]|uniref:GTP pyrophosphokinase n=1 Tax=Blautia sp. MSJ-19 TaxID=2841517 RepID=UPI001C0EFC60|nr:GTP pyrophosphokinase [Blautia sp. MSJ-19]MBU5480205.1 GTP pyrophosphokinase [Blautia sp. MSJ-19]